MKSFTAIALALGAVSPVLGQIFTTTLPWANGDTVVVSQTTNALGTIAIQTVSTVAGVAAVTPIVPGGVVAASSSSSRSSSSRSSASSRSTTARATLTQGNQNPVGAPPSETFAPMTATTYGYMNTDGVWTTGTWVQSYTPPAEATATVAAGTILDYGAYQSAANSAVFNAAAGADASANPNSGAEKRVAFGAGLSLLVGAGVALGAALV